MDIFISYSSKDRGVVESLVSVLEELGQTIWFDRKLTGGHDWWADILHNIRRCDLFLFALTPQSLDSYPCKLEYEYASALNKRVLPVVLLDMENATLPSLLQKIQFVGYQQQNKQELIALTKALNTLPAVRPLPDPLPPEPEAPLSLLVRLRDQIDTKVLSENRQRLLVSRLKEFMEQEETASDARELLERLKVHPTLLAKIDREITALLNSFFPDRITLNRPANRVKLTTRVFTGHADSVSTLAFSPDGKTILTGSNDASARLWDVTTGQEIRRFIGHTQTITSLAFSPNGNMALTGSEDLTARLWDIATGKEIRQFTGHARGIISVAFSPDGQYVLTGSKDNTARLWPIDGD